MNARDWAFLGCRMVALVYAVNALTRLPVSILAYATLPTSIYEKTDPTLRLLQIAPVGFLASQLLISGILYFGASWISSVMARSSSRASCEPRPTATSKVGAFLVALYFALAYVPDFLGSLYRFAVDRSTRETSDLIANAIAVAGSATHRIV